MNLVHYGRRLSHGAHEVGLPAGQSVPLWSIVLRHCLTMPPHI